jgi:hypothetical protein
MFSSRAQRRTSLLAVFVLLWSLVFPALASVSQNQASSAFTEICTAHGIQKIPQNTGNSHPLGHHVTVAHCALCCLDGIQAVVEPISLQSGLELDTQTYPLPQLSAALPEQFILLTAPPRAPPFPS